MHRTTQAKEDRFEMRFRLTVALVALAIAACAGSAHAQRRAQNRQRAANIAVAQVPVALIDGICKLEPAQKEKITSIQTKLAEDLKQLRPQRGAAPDPEALQKRRDLTRAAVSEIDSILTPEQRESLRKAMPLLSALRGANIPLEAIQDLKLTDEQKKQIMELMAGQREKLKNLPAEERRTKMREMMTEVRTKIQALLTDEQKETLKKFAEKRRNPRKGSKP
jgi:Spy/CpxP family protein refolding chaperone